MSLGLITLCIFLFAHQFQLVYFSPLIKRIDGLIYDYIISMKGQKRDQSVKVVIIDIDNRSVESEGRWPWPRDKIASLLARLKQSGVTVAAFDIVFSEAEINYAQGLKEKLIRMDFPKPPLRNQITTFLDSITQKVDNDEELAETLKKNEVVLGYLFHHDASTQEGALPKPLLDKKATMSEAGNFPIPIYQGYNGLLPLFLKASPHSGFVSNAPDLDAVIRHGYLIAKFDNQLYGSLTLSIVMQYLMASKLNLVTHINLLGKKIFDGLSLDGFFIPTNQHGQILIPFWDSPDAIVTYSACDILQNKISSKELEGSIAIVGSSMVLLADLHQSPVSSFYPGVEMVANMVSGIISHQLVKEFYWDSIHALLLMMLLGGILILVFSFVTPFILMITWVFSISLILLGVFGLLFFKNYYFAPTALLLLISVLALINLVYDFRLEKKQKNRIRQLFDMYVPPSYVREIMDNPERYSTEGENREMTVFFADIRGFTTLSESLDANEVKHLLNEFFTPITNIIFKHQGTIDKYVGDMVMAFWGAPLPDPQHALHGVQMALDIRSSLGKINYHLIKQNLPEIALGMGLNSGMMNVGDMGSSFRRSYTVIGDQVNLGSRLQDLTKFYQVDILVSETTRANQDSILWRPIDKVAVKGRHKALIIYEPLGYYQKASSDMKEGVQVLELALKSYYDRDWVHAKKLFQALAKREPEVWLYSLYLSRIETFSKNPPPDNWDGTFIHTQK